MKILLLGAAGFIGTNLTIELAKKTEDEITLVDRSKAFFKPIVSMDLKNVHILEADLTVDMDFDSILKDQEVVYHLVSTTVPTTSNQHISQELVSNVIFSANLFEACIRCGVKKVVFVSSGGTVYGKEVDCPLKEKTATNPISSYGVQKITIEKLLYLYKDLYFRRDEIFHVPGLGFNGLIGFSPIAMMKNSLGTSIAVDKYGSSFFKNGAQPSGVLEHPGVVKDPNRIRDSWEAAYGGAANAHRVAVLEEGMAYKPISLPPEDSQFLETKQFSVTEICRIFRVPPHLVADLSRATFSNIEYQSLNFVMHSLTPWLVRIEQGIIKDLLLEEEQDTYFPKFNVDGLLRGDYQSRMNGYATGISNGFLSPNDVHRLENMDLIPAEEGGDDYYLNGGYVKLKDAGVAQQNKAAAAQQNQPKETQPDPEEEPDSDNRLSESKPRKNGRRTR